MKTRFLCLLLSVLMLCAPAYAQTVVGDLDARLNAGRVEFEGVSYRPRRRLTSILLIGTDRHADDTAYQDYRSGGQADFLVLLVVDDNAETVVPIQLNRDTMAEIMTLSSFGQEMGLMTSQLCLAHSYGDGAGKSCELTRDAVSRLLGDITIDNYVSLNLDGIPVLNDLLGGVTVTLEDDFSAYDPTMTPGTTLVLRGPQAEYFVRMRYYVGDASNVSRLSRQKVYMQGAAAQLRQKLGENASFASTLFDTLSPYLTSDMARGRMINMAERANRYEILPMVEIPGQGWVGQSGHMEFYPDETALRRIILSVFYDRIS